MDVSGGGIPGFDGGPLGNLSTILGDFDFSFGGFLEEYLTLFDNFTSDTSNARDPDLPALADLKPSSGLFPRLLQLGSKKPSDQLSSKLKARIWNKLILEFPSATWNGVRIPGLALGKTLEDTFDEDNFPGERCDS